MHRSIPRLACAACALVAFASRSPAQDALPPCGRSVAYDVNDAGWIVGSVEVPTEGRLAVAWVGDSVVRLGSLGGATLSEP